MKLKIRLTKLYMTPLPDDLLILLAEAKVFLYKGNTMRAHAILNIIERECSRRNIVITNLSSSYLENQSEE